MTSLAKALHAALRARFGRGVAGYVVRELDDGEHAGMRASFVLYEYWEIDFVYDRGAFGFSIPFRNSDVPVMRGPQAGQSIEDLDGILAELQEKVLSRIPDKYLQTWEAP